MYLGSVVYVLNTFSTRSFPSVSSVQARGTQLGQTDHYKIPLVLVYGVPETN